MKMKKHKLQLSEPYHRTLCASLSVVDEMLSELDDLLEGEHIGSIFTEVVNTLDSKDRQSIHEKVKNMCHKIKDIKTTLGLSSKVVSNKALISSRCGKIWEILSGLETKRLRNYGEPPDGLSKYLDCRIDELIDNIGEIAELTGKKKNGYSV